MKKKTFLLLLLLAIVGATTFTSCTKEDGVATEDSMNVVDSFLTRSSEQVVHFNIGYGVENNVVFDVYAENPYEITSEGLNLKEGVSPILSSVTDSKGSYNISRVISGGVKEVYIASECEDVPVLLHGVISNGVVEPQEVAWASDEVSRAAKKEKAPKKNSDKKPGKGDDKKPGKGDDKKPGKGDDKKPGKGDDKKPGKDDNEFTEEMIVVQDLSMVFDVKPKFKKLLVTSESKMNVDVRSYEVTGTNDVLYIAKANAMEDFVATTYSTSDSKRKVVVRTTVKFTRSAEEEESGEQKEGEKKKGRTVVRTTVKLSSWDDAGSRAMWTYKPMLDVEQAIAETLERYSKNIERGEVIEIVIDVDFEKGVNYNKFVKSIAIPPYAPFIEHID